MGPDRNRHMDAEEIEQYTMGDTSDEECTCVEEHLLICDSCRERVSAEDNFVYGMREAAGQLRRQPSAQRPIAWWWPRLVPAMLALALITAVLWQSGRTPVFAVSLAVVRGSNPAAQAPSGSPLDLRLDLNALPSFNSYRVEVVDSVGNRVWQGATTSGAAACRIPALLPGAYFVRVSLLSGEMLREYALETASR